jgi:hypothetical protein
MSVAHLLEQGLGSEEAGRTVAEQAVAGRDAKLLIVFTSESHDLDALVRGIRSVSGDASLIGCTTAGEISGTGAGDGGVVVTALGGDGFEVRTAAGRGGHGELRKAGAAAAAAIADLDRRLPNRALLLLSDGASGNQQEMIRGVHEVVGSTVPLVGGCAGDAMKMERTFQIHGDEVISGGVAAAAIASDGPIGIGWSHGWERTGEPMLVTNSRGNHVIEIDDQPALDEYLKRLQAPAEVGAEAQEFTRWARTHPLGLGQRPNGHEPVRCVSEADFGGRSIICTAEVPAGGLIWFMHGDGDSVLRSTASACEQALAGLGDSKPLGLLAFDCIGRRGVLTDERIADEVDRIRDCVGEAPFAGLYTYGEIARVKGVNALHSQTFVALALG